MLPQELRGRLARLPSVPLILEPTPLHRLERLSGKLAGPEIWIKRDDLTGFGGGGNKGRKLEFLMGAAIKADADRIITCGAQQSNHARQTAAAAAVLGLPCLLMLTGGPETKTGNQVLDRWFGAEIEFLGDISWGQLRQATERRMEEYRAQGNHPYLIPVGGSTPLGALGFVTAAAELVEQGPHFDAIYFASSSGSTQAGLAAGLAYLNQDTRVQGIMVDSSRNEPAADFAKLANGVSELLGIDRRFAAAEINCEPNHVGEGYAIPSSEGVAAIRLLAQSEGLLLDPVYTSKAFAGMVSDIKSGNWRGGHRVLFWHTGGIPGLFAQGYTVLPLP